MSRRHRHHRLQSQSRQELSIESTAPASSIADPVSSSLSVVRHDLTKTIIISSVLLLILITISVINSRQPWTLSLGARLYQLLHIR